jgi:hypothetical protein
LFNCCDLKPGILQRCENALRHILRGFKIGSSF